MRASPMESSSRRVSLGGMNTSSSSAVTYSAIVISSLATPITYKMHPNRSGSPLNNLSHTLPMCNNDPETPRVKTPDCGSPHYPKKVAAQQRSPRTGRIFKCLVQRKCARADEANADSETVTTSCELRKTISPGPSPLLSSSSASRLSPNKPVSRESSREPVSTPMSCGSHSTRGPSVESSSAFPHAPVTVFYETPVRRSENSVGGLCLGKAAVQDAMDATAHVDPEAQALLDTPNAPISRRRIVIPRQVTLSAGTCTGDPRRDTNSCFLESHVSTSRQMTPTTATTLSRGKATELLFREAESALAFDLFPNGILTSSRTSDPQRTGMGSARLLRPSARSEATTAMRASRSVPVTLMDTRRTQRAKHTKRVSSYILGPLFGEGTYSMVRDAIDTSANHVIPPRFHRVAIKSFKRKHKHSGAAGMMGASKSHSSQVSVGALSKLSLACSKTQRQDAKMRSMFEAEMGYLQRFHCPTIIRAIDIFSRNGKDYVVLPIAVCNIAQLVEEKNSCEKCAKTEQTMESPAKGPTPKTTTTTTIATTAAATTTITPRVTPRASKIATGKTTSGRSSTDAKDSAAEPIKDDDSSVGKSSSPNANLSNGGTAALPNGSQENVNAHTLSFSAALVKGIIYQLLHGVAYLHRQGLAHNDLKPHNILLFDDGLLRISDLGSVGADYNDGGTPMYTSPEVCRYYYHADESSEGSSNSSSSSSSSGGGGGSVCRDKDDEAVANGESKKDEVKHHKKADAQRNDMWSCGMILYYIMTGQHLWSHKGCQNRYQLYRRIASQRRCGPVPLGSVLEPCADALPVHAMWTHMPHSGNDDKKDPASVEFPPTSLRHLLSRLLEMDPAARLTAEEAIRHPALHTELILSTEELTANTTNKLLDGAKADVACRALQFPPLRAFIQRDHERHLQFTAECCYVLGISMPPEIFRRKVSPKNTVHRGGDRINANNGNTEGTSNPDVPRGTVDDTLFPSEADQRYYEKKLGRPEHDVRFIHKNLSKVAMMRDYLYKSVLVDYGFLPADPEQEKNAQGMPWNQQALEAKETTLERPMSGKGADKGCGKTKSKVKLLLGELTASRRNSLSSSAIAKETGPVPKTRSRACICVIL